MLRFPLHVHQHQTGFFSKGHGVCTSHVLLVLKDDVLPMVLLQVVPVPRQALAAATLAVEPEQGADGEKDTSVKLCDKMVR